MRQGNIRDFLVFLQAIVYIGSGDFFRKTSHCSSAKAHKYNRKTKPQLVHKNILEQWNKKSKIGILEFCTNSAREETRLFESFLITFMKNYGYRLANNFN